MSKQEEYYPFGNLENRQMTEFVQILAGLSLDSVSNQWQVTRETRGQGTHEEELGTFSVILKQFPGQVVLERTDTGTQFMDLRASADVGVRVVSRLREDTTSYNAILLEVTQNGVFSVYTFTPTSPSSQLR